jgi:hypothetical protein
MSFLFRRWLDRAAVRTSGWTPGADFLPGTVGKQLRYIVFSSVVDPILIDYDRQESKNDPQK